MWLSNLFTKTNNNECNDSINEDIANEESINVSSNQEEEPVINDLKERVERVKMIYAKLQILQNKQDLDLNNNCTNTVDEKHDQCTSTNENEKNLEINNCKIDDVLKIIPVIESNLQILTEKVNSCIIQNICDSNFFLLFLNYCRYLVFLDYSMKSSSILQL